MLYSFELLIALNLQQTSCKKLRFKKGVVLLDEKEAKASPENRLGD